MGQPAMHKIESQLLAGVFGETMFSDDEAGRIAHTVTDADTLASCLRHSDCSWPCETARCGETHSTHELNYSLCSLPSSKLPNVPSHGEQV